ncbi:hypothetical protein PsYK624_017100 [Phanerochaete sordida]|uniref:Hypervirulence associated protein TUDOR domain-containing protein n=1 Tax=Phanerochaete sordida TaxID=48140 RepID=A0A9P3L812_9APHY|nr:hypothetical protein PsYK624_017100 [Phanerochaete sordida]
MSEMKDKNGEPIQEGDKVITRFRGGRREGVVEQIVMDDADASKVSGDVNIKNPPKVVFSDQHGHKVAHNPGTLSRSD